MMKHLCYGILTYFFIILLAACGKEDVMTPVTKNCTLDETQKTVIEELNGEYAYAFDSDDPEMEEAALDPLLDYLGEAAIVGLGEATHGSAEFFRMKDKIFRGLVRKKGFKAIIFEIPWGNALVINDYVKNGKGNLDAAFNQSFYWVYDTQETRDLAQWMREYNQQADESDQIYLVGCDPQGPDFEVERGVVLDYLLSYGESMFDTVFLKYSQLPTEDFSNYGSLPQTEQIQHAENVQWVYNYLSAHRDSLVSRSGRFDYEMALMASHVIKYREFIYRKQSFGQTRDSLMAVYSTWWQEILGDNAQVAVWAHNFHVMDNQASSAKWMGSYLRNHYGQDYKNVGFSFSTGALNAFYANAAGNFLSAVRQQFVPEDECETLNFLFYQAEPDQYYMIFDQWNTASESYLYLSQSRDFFQMGAGFNRNYMRNYTQALILPELWDVMIHFDRVAASDLE